MRSRSPLPLSPAAVVIKGVEEAVRLLTCHGEPLAAEARVPQIESVEGVAELALAHGAVPASHRPHSQGHGQMEEGGGEGERRERGGRKREGSGREDGMAGERRDRERVG